MLLYSGACVNFHTTLKSLVIYIDLPVREKLYSFISNCFSILSRTDLENMVACIILYSTGYVNY